MNYWNQTENPAYIAINKPQGRLVLAGEYSSFLSSWMEGAVRSAEFAVKRVVNMPAGQTCAANRNLFYH
jgi:monoamine oxidase